MIRASMVADLAARTGLWLVSLALVGSLFGLYLFVLNLPSLHKGALHASRDRPKELQAMAEYVQPQKEKPRPSQSRGGQARMAQAAGGPPGSGDRTEMRFSPDLSVSGGADAASLGMGGMEAVVFEEGQTETDAMILSSTEVEYPFELRRDGVSGRVMAVLVIAETGSVASVDITESPHPRLSDQVRNTVRHWKFKPASNKGVPVRVRVRMPLDFTLDS